ncbi:hypothetical protein [Sulfurimonas sp.]
MKILLVNDNPVVTKLVSLSAQKTNDEVEIVSEIEDISSDSYDLLVLDDALYSAETYKELKEKVQFKKSLFICARDTQSEEDFSATIKKPFLPTDLVELFSGIKRSLDAVREAPVEELADIEDSDDLLESLDDVEGLDDLETLDDDFVLEEDEVDREPESESILDDEEAQKVKDLLDETEDNEIDESEYDIALDLEDEADVDISDEKHNTDLEELGLENEEVEELEEVEDLSFDDEVELDLEELDLENELTLDDELEDEILKENLDTQEIEIDDNDDNIEAQIQDAMSDLSTEDLESEVDEDTLLEIASNEIDSFASINATDLKVALGEEVDENLDDMNENTEEIALNETQNSNESSSVESLKTLLKALNDKDVVASMKGAKITINITFEDN